MSMKYGHKQALEEFRKFGCLMCGALDNLTAHHLDPATKLFSPGRTSSLPGIAKYKAELAKCVCLCRACHDCVHNDRLTLAEYLAQ